MRYYNIELTKKNWELVKPLLVNKGLYFEPSGCGELVHIEVKCTAEMAAEVNKELDTIL